MKLRRPKGAKAADQALFEDLVDDLANEFGFARYEAEGWLLPASSSWEETFSHYNKEMTNAGWEGEGEVEKRDDVTVGLWINEDTSTGLLLAHFDSPDGDVAVAVFGEGGEEEEEDDDEDDEDYDDDDEDDEFEDEDDDEDEDEDDKD